MEAWPVTGVLTHLPKAKKDKEQGGAWGKGNTPLLSLTFHSQNQTIGSCRREDSVGIGFLRAAAAAAVAKFGAF